MSQRDGFASGFVAGTIVGSVLGGAIGALLVSQRLNEPIEGNQPRKNANLSNGNSGKKRRRQLQSATSEQTIEIARRNLEDKIAQLNDTIDEVRLTLGQVNGNQPESDQEQNVPREDITL